VHYTMEGAYKNDVKQLTILRTFLFIFTIRFRLGVLQSPPLIYALSLCIMYTYTTKFSKILKNMWVFCPHCILMLPSSALRTVLGPLDIYNPYGPISELFDFLIQNAYWMHLESTFLLHLNHIPINNMINIMYIFLEQ
jgi:hypothetical protein